jgi:dihydroceramidase
MSPHTITNNGSPLLIFEPPATYLRHSTSNPGYWPVESSIDWCEKNYIVSFFVAEFWNTLSNIGLILLGLFGLWMALRNGMEFRFCACHVCSVVIGIGSAAFHGTLTHVGQQGDETPMMFFCCVSLLCVFFLDPATEKKWDGRLFACACVCTTIFAVGFAVVHYYLRFVLVFQGFIALSFLGGLYLLRPHQKKCANPSAHRLGCHYYIGSILFAFVLWSIDQQFCVHLHNMKTLPNPQLHAWWHFGCAIHMYSFTTFVTYQRQVYIGKFPMLKYALGVIPYVQNMPSKK